jgi:RNA polymerase-binding transcription factor DksA
MASQTRTTTDHDEIRRWVEQYGGRPARAIERAQDRLRDGTYGRSVVSGKPMPDEHLEAIPWADRTAEEPAG